MPSIRGDVDNQHAQPPVSKPRKRLAALPSWWRRTPWWLRLLLAAAIAGAAATVILDHGAGLVAVPAPATPADPSVRVLDVATGQAAQVVGVQSGTGPRQDLCAAQPLTGIPVGSALLELTVASIHQKVQVISVDMWVQSVTPVAVCSRVAAGPTPSGAQTHGPVIHAASADLTASGFLPGVTPIGPSVPVDFSLGPNGQRVIELAVHSADHPAQPELYQFDVNVEMSHDTSLGQEIDSADGSFFLLVM